MTSVHVLHGDSLEVLRRMPAGVISAVVTDPPYGLGTPPDMAEVLAAWLAGEAYVPRGKGFMGKAWDAFVPGPELWREVLRVLKPGGHLACFAGTRTADVMGLALRLAGFEIRDTVAWLYGSGFPKSLDVSKALDAAAGAERTVVGVHRRHGGGSPSSGSLRGPLGTSSTLPATAPATPEAAAWEGWGTALKPGHEPILLARKPLQGTVADNVLAHGTGGINVDACRLGEEIPPTTQGAMGYHGAGLPTIPSPLGRWPANVALDEGTAEELDAFTGPRRGMSGGGQHPDGAASAVAFGSGDAKAEHLRGDNGGPSRFFYCAKASRSEREAGLEGWEETRRADGREGDCANPHLRTAPRRNHHPTVKPLALMRWLVRLITPPGGLVLDPFGGSGTTGAAMALEGFGGFLVEREAEYVEIARARVAHHMETGQ